MSERCIQWFREGPEPPPQLRALTLLGPWLLSFTLPLTLGTSLPLCLKPHLLSTLGLRFRLLTLPEMPVPASFSLPAISHPSPSPPLPPEPSSPVLVLGPPVVERSLRSTLCIFLFIYLFIYFAFSRAASRGIWRFPGERSNRSCSHRPTPEPLQHGIRAPSATYTTAHGNAGSLTH